MPEPKPLKLCECGCGGVAPIAKRTFAKNILKQGLKLLSGCGTQSDTKQKRGEASINNWSL